ncbi:MAG: 5-formyltetrahydrofolate cyclo-ligase [Candidatus Micrarchaeia archaeon]
MENKDLLREKYSQLRAEAHQKLRHDDKAKIFSNLRQLPAFSKAKTIMAYSSKGSEVNMRNFILELLNGEKQIALPRTNVADNSITPYLIDSLDQLELCSFGVLEPKLDCKICPASQIDVILVPGVAFDETGHRLGYGLGFYDRFLANVKITSIGLCYDVQITNRLPTDSYDVPLNFVVSEKRIIDPSKK